VYYFFINVVEIATNQPKVYYKELQRLTFKVAAVNCCQMTKFTLQSKTAPYNGFGTIEDSMGSCKSSFERTKEGLYQNA
jgi:hypothetical protein